MTIKLIKFEGTTTWYSIHVYNRKKFVGSIKAEYHEIEQLIKERIKIEIIKLNSAGE